MFLCLPAAADIYLVSSRHSLCVRPFKWAINRHEIDKKYGNDLWSRSRPNIKLSPPTATGRTVGPELRDRPVAPVVQSLLYYDRTRSQLLYSLFLAVQKKYWRGPLFNNKIRSEYLISIQFLIVGHRKCIYLFIYLFPFHLIDTKNSGGMVLRRGDTLLLFSIIIADILHVLFVAVVPASIL